MENGRTAALLMVGVLIGAALGYIIARQMTGSVSQDVQRQIAELQSQVNELQAILPKGNIVIKGSDTLLIGAQRWAESFMTKYKNVKISVAGGGSGVGFVALIDKTTDIADASREIKASELASARSKGVTPVEWVVGLDGISIVANNNNPATELTMEQLEKIYNGTYTNWNQVGGKNEVIVTYGRQSTSGTYDFFKEHVLHTKNFRADNRELAGNAEIVQAVEGDARGIGYVGVAYTKQGVNLKILRMKASASALGYEPSIPNIKSGIYPIARKLYIYTNGVPTGTLGEYVAYILGPAGQKILEEVGYISLAQRVP